MKRNAFVYIFKLCQLIIMGLITMTLFIRTNMGKDNVTDGSVYVGALFFTVIMTMFNGMAGLSMTIAKLPVFYKQRDLLFYPAWAYALPSWLLKISVTFLEVGVYVLLTYYIIGFDPNLGRLLKQYLLLLLVNQMASGLFQTMAALGRNMIVANTFGAFALILIFSLGGFVLSREDVKPWWKWGYWSSPLMYAQNAIAVNEFLGHSWSKPVVNSTVSLGVTVLEFRGFFPKAYWYWLGVGALIGFVLLFNLTYTMALTYLNPFGKTQSVTLEDSQNDNARLRKNSNKAYNTSKVLSSLCMVIR